MHAFSPVALFTYARPEHTRRTIEALANNLLADQTELYVFSDAPSSESKMESVIYVRQYIQNIKGFAKLHLIERPYNYGLADSIVDGVSYILKMHSTVIVLEDDIITSKYFLKFMNDSLSRYEHEEKVMHIAAHMFPFLDKSLPETFFLRQVSCWGWGTWARAWKHFSRDTNRFISTFDDQKIHEFNLGGAYNYWEQLIANHEGRLKSWAVFWYASVFEKGGLSLNPRQSLVKNIGFDGSGVNCGSVDFREEPFQEDSISEFPIKIVVNISAKIAYANVLQPIDKMSTAFMNRTVRQNVKKILLKLFGSTIVSLLKDYGTFFRLHCRCFLDHSQEKTGNIWAIAKTAKVNTANVSLKSSSSFYVGEKSIIEARIVFEREGAIVRIGDRSFIGGSSIYCATKIEIGNDVLISFGVSIADHDSHSTIFDHRKNDVLLWYDGKKDWTNVRSRPVVIGDRVWIGMHSIILEGVTIGEGSVIGAGSVVTNDVAPYTIVAGNPARKIRKIDSPERGSE